MSDIKNALRKLGAKCIEAGHSVKGDTVGEILDCIGDHYAGGGGSNLPAVTAADNGNVLTVVNGEWDAAQPSSGTEIVNITLTPKDENFTTADVKRDNVAITGSEILALYNAGKIVKATIIANGVYIVGNIFRYTSEAVEFSAFSENPTTDNLAFIDAILGVSSSEASITFTDIENAAGE